MSHDKFILFSLESILLECSFSSSLVGSGIEVYPLSDYIMQSLFLKMTGAQEQKMKCICWELATNDYEYRYKRFKQNTLGECSSYQEKNQVYDDLINQINKYSKGRFDLEVFKKDANFLNGVNKKIEDVFQGSNLLSLSRKEFYEYQSYWGKFDDCFFIGINKSKSKKEALFVGSDNVPGNEKVDFLDIYTSLYKNRNKLAHNTLSYQQNLPTLDSLRDDNYIYNNYFVYFSLLILIDDIFISLYKEYLKYFNVYT